MKLNKALSAALHHSFFTLLVILPLANQSLAQSKAAPYVGDSFDDAPCRGGSQGYGPYDYTQRSKHQKNLHLVESTHFLPVIQQLVRGHTSVSPLPDLDYTLRAFPNHHPALYSVIQLRASPELYKFSDVSRFTPAECWLQRAIYFSPKDSMNYMLYGLLLHRTNKYEQAIEKYQISLELNPSNAQTMYNFGLLLTDLKRFDEAKRYATILYGKKFPLQGLKNRLITAGHWDQ